MRAFSLANTDDRSTGISLEPVNDRRWLSSFIADQWGGDIVSRGEPIRSDALEGIRAIQDGEVAGLVTWRDIFDARELVTLNALVPRQGVGSMLLQGAVDSARLAGLLRLRLVTTNDNLDALRFYQRRGFHICAVRPGAAAENRTIKPSIPEIGAYDIPIRDEIDLERVL